ncbi:MAG TPA: patatin-like phospholipase family protein, partial [Thermoanaerobaculia bacterium]|nr:patatin-like phospholipase family protein [Thermoanaerobaculia bacterium]
MPDPAESRGAIPLYQVLVEEYNHQYPDLPISLDEIEAKRQDYTQEYDGEHPNGEPATPERVEERRKAVDYRLVREFYSRLHAQGRQGEPGKRVDRAALCFSGGGIRSATFGLGVIQGLAHLGLLGKFDYLSTVSGGGYLGSWLSAWIKREPKGVEEVEEQLRRPPRFPLSPEPQPVAHLRSYSRYMSPSWGLLSADTWTLVAIFFRNLFLNWLVLLPLLAAFLMIPRISVYLVRQQHLAWWGPPAVFWLGLLSGIVAIAYIGINRPSLVSRPALFRFPERWRSQEWFLTLCLLPLAFMAIAVSLYWAWVPIPLERLSFDVLGWRIAPMWAFILFGLALHGGAYAVARLFVRSPWREVLGVVVTGGIGGFAAWLAASRLFPLVRTWQEAERYVSFSAPLLLFLFLLVATLFVGLSSKYTGDEDREWLARGGAWILIFIVLRSSVGLLVIYGPVAWHFVGAWLMGLAGGISGLVTLLLGHSAETGAGEKKNGEPPSISSRLANAALALAAPLFTLTIVVGLAFGTTFLIRIVTALLRPGFEWPLDVDNPDDPYEHLTTLFYTPGLT